MNTMCYGLESLKHGVETRHCSLGCLSHKCFPALSYFLIELCVSYTGFFSRLSQRGVGEGAVGCSLSLVAAGEDKSHAQIIAKLKVQFENVVLDGRLLTGAQERVNLATKVVVAEKVQSNCQQENAWFRDKAEEIGVELDDDMVNDGLDGGNERDRNQLRESKRAMLRLQKLLKQPLQTQRFGKFLSTNSAAVR